MKSAREIADAQMAAFTEVEGSRLDDDEPLDYDVVECSAQFIRDQIEDAIEADRAQRQTDADEAAEWAAEVYQNLREPDHDSTESWDNDSLAECATWAARKALGVPAWEGERA